MKQSVREQDWEVEEGSCRLGVVVVVVVAVVVTVKGSSIHSC